MVAGQLIEEVSGQTWEAFVRDHVFKPSGMRVSTSDEKDHFATANRAHPQAVFPRAPTTWVVGWPSSWVMA